MTDTPKDGDIGSRDGWELRRWSDGAWRFADEETDEMPVIPTGERAIPIDVCEEVAEYLRSDYCSPVWGSFADVLDAPTPTPDEPTPTPDEPRWPENTVLAYGGGLFRYIVNAEGVPCDACADRPTTYPLDSDLWRVIGTFNPKKDA